MPDILMDLLRVAQCNRFVFTRKKGVKPQWCTTCRQFLSKNEQCPVVSVVQKVASDA